MSKSEDAKQPAQVPGDAESPPKGAPDPAIQKGMQQSDKTEPVQSAQDQGRSS